MKRRTFFRQSTLGTAAWASVAASVSAQASNSNTTDSAVAAANPDAIVSSPPVVWAPRADGAELVWAVPTLSRGWVEYGTTQELGQKAGANSWGFVPQSDKVLRVRLDGLKPGTTYYYCCVTERQDEAKTTHRTEVRSFRTLNPAADSTKFTIWNDTHQYDKTIQALAEATPASDFLLWNGDTCNDWKSPDLLAPTVLSPAGGVELTAKSPLFLVRGNHDVRGPWAFKLPEYYATPYGRPFFSFRTGPVAVICLDTCEDKSDDHPSFQGRAAFEPLRREQAAWLEKEIAKPEFANAPYRIMICHIPMRWLDEEVDAGFDYFSKRSRDLWHDALVRWKTQVVISGHMHKHAWMPPTAEFPYAQITGGGPKYETATIITGEADANAFRVTIRKLADGAEEVHEFKPLA